jgi:outer membrane immunogenic protein
MMRFLVAVAMGVASLVPGVVGQALAADLPEPAAPPRAPATYVPTVAPVYDWGGIYMGVNGGYGFGKSEWTDPNNLSGLGSTGNFNLSGYAAGATVGANFQVDAFVFGAEGDFDMMGIDGKVSSAFCGAVGFGASAQCETKETWLGTLRARIGYAVDRVLFYGTAGGAYGNIETGVAGNLVSSSKAGWTAGAGVEAALADNWTARVEYLYVDLQNATCSTSANCGNNFTLGVGAVPANDTIKFSTSLIRLGVDYKFH